MPVSILPSRRSGRGPRSTCSLGSSRRAPRDRRSGLRSGQLHPSPAERFAASEIVAIDTSDSMLGAARARLPGVRIDRASVENWKSDSPVDLIFAAVMQSVPDHFRGMTDLLGNLARGGCFAAQIPDNFGEPSHALMREVALRPRFRDKLATANRAREPIAFEALAPLCESVDIWRTTYLHRLAAPDAIVEWVKGTGLRPFLDPLSSDECADFLVQYRAEIAKAYPALANGEALLPFPRLFIVAARGHG